MPAVPAPFDTDYSIAQIGISVGLPNPYGGLVFSRTNSEVMLVGGASNNSGSALFSVPVVRDVNYLITAVGAATSTFHCPYIDGGVAYHPSGVLFCTGYPANIIHQYKTTDTLNPSKTTLMDSYGIAASLGSLGFIPAGFPGAGKFMIVSWPTGESYFLTLVPDPDGTYNFTTRVTGPVIPGGPEGFVYVPLGSAQFPNPSILVTEYSGGRVTAYELDSNGFPIISSARPMVTGLANAEGAALDPLTGAYLFTTFSASDSFYVLSGGFVPPDPPPPPPDPEPFDLSFRLEYFKGIGGASDQGVFIQLKTDVPTYQSKIGKEEYYSSGEPSDFMDGIFAVPGVVEAASNAFRIYIEKSPIFSWSEVLGPVIEFVRTTLGAENLVEAPGSMTLTSENDRRTP